jgi:hypothetical protein
MPARQHDPEWFAASPFFSVHVQQAKEPDRDHVPHLTGPASSAAVRIRQALPVEAFRLAQEWAV